MLNNTWKIQRTWVFSDMKFEGPFWQKAQTKEKCITSRWWALCRFCQETKIYSSDFVKQSKIADPIFIRSTLRQDKMFQLTDWDYISAGWYLWNISWWIAEYVNQSYKDFLDYRRDGGKIQMDLFFRLPSSFDLPLDVSSNMSVYLFCAIIPGLWKMSNLNSSILPSGKLKILPGW